MRSDVLVAGSGLIVSDSTNENESVRDQIFGKLWGRGGERIFCSMLNQACD